MASEAEVEVTEELPQHKISEQPKRLPIGLEGLSDLQQIELPARERSSSASLGILNLLVIFAGSFHQSRSVGFDMLPLGVLPGSWLHRPATVPLESHHSFRLATSYDNHHIRCSTIRHLYPGSGFNVHCRIPIPREIGDSCGARPASSESSRLWK